ncbi:MAG TPA: CDP-diacylglycerol--serine O-phosphatidyltransferase [Saprospiraceae bacterium]|nr:CDP-diacylglycerol--serine O-phosphatidyltransferase [Saprospiraceae bacterium]HMQ82801.1 CDP-diacylglycerol--serine O-phosphatidyltransferase [Saprospiraceae bacterium]
MKNHVPNAITLLNLFFGCCAIASLFYGKFETAFYFITCAVIADFADGLVARMLNVSSPMGKELDSLADMVSFGVVPGVIYYMLLLVAWDKLDSSVLYPAALPGFILSLFSALRLAKFNLDERQTDGFLGLPTPSSTIFAAGLMLIYDKNSLGLGHLVATPGFLYSCIAVLCFLLVSEIPMFSLKLKRFEWKGNEIKFIFAAIAVVLLLLVKEAAFATIIFLYAAFSSLRFLLKPKSL